MKLLIDSTGKKKGMVSIFIVDDIEMASKRQGGEPWVYAVDVPPEFGIYFTYDGKHPRTVEGLYIRMEHGGKVVNSV